MAQANRLARMVGFVGFVVAGSMLFGGCSGMGQADYELLMDENTELRRRLAQAQGENGQLREQLTAAQTQNTVVDPDPYATGFEGLNGVEAHLNTSGEVVVAIAGDVLFDSGSIALKSSSKSSLDRIAQVLMSRYAGHPVRVEGYTDTDPIRQSDWVTNERLSAERAMAVESYLVDNGVPNERIYSAAFGPADPLATKRESRRVEIVILASGG